MWGASVEFWAKVGDWTLVAALILGGLAALTSFASSFISSRVTARVQEAASEETSRLGTVVATANEGAAKATATAVLASERIAVLEGENLKLQEKLEKERTGRLKLEESVAPRTLTAEQSASLTEALKNITPSSVIHLLLIGDEEANQFGKAIAEALEAAQVHGKAEGIGMMVPPPYGVKITLKPNDPRAQAIRSAFEGAHISATFEEGSTAEYDATILVGLRPLGPRR